MKTNSTTKILTLIALVVTVFSAKAQITADEAAVAMDRGINLGNTFDATNYEGGWALPAREYYFEMYAEAGFKTVRIPVTWNLRIGAEEPYDIDEAFAKRLDTVINWALDRGLNVIIF